ncbi:TylF/MycF/NovP-related O-methyltransferase [Mycobacteroides franklinii]|uniref:TylF/MycF/NovP-related O-methyltransferase n=1 Tax=Mycobacteroides franklinii TaxID=948102 RepID=UPI0009922E41|nr:TylF/MycF/NovP-related O-methyltransferase [Mycobacteroides franklinii]
MLGLAITTHNRRDVLLNALAHWIEHTPADVPIVVVDDGSDEPLCLEGWRGIPLDRQHQVKVVRHPFPKGIAMAKNRCISELVDLGCEHLFLADDDVWATADKWWKPYVDSPEPHLSFQWPSRGRHCVTYQDENHFAIGFPRGVLLYVERRVIDVVGGMDTSYGAHGGEHVDWSHRIHESKLTSWPFADVRGSHRLLYSRDKSEGNTIGSSRFDVYERRRLCEANGHRWGRRWPTWPHFPYREGEGVQDFSLGPTLSDTYEGTLDHVLGLHPFGVAVEFGVGEGGSLRRIAARMPVWGFDSWQGLPEDWEPGRFDKGHFACPPPDVENATLVQGWFQNTLPAFNFAALGPVGLWHIDADLYSSTMTILESVEQHIIPGAYLVFDEYHGFDRCVEHEQRAFREWAGRNRIGWTVVGKGPEQWAIRIV